MSADRPTLYSPELLQHARQPRHAGTLDQATRSARVDSPLCGDRVTLQVRVSDGRIEAIAHQTRGCALCVASVSIMADAVLDTPLEEALGRARAVVQALDPVEGAPESVGKPALRLFGGLSAAPGRWGCVALPWQALLG